MVVRMQAGEEEQQQDAQIIQLPRNQINPQRPPESDEQRAGMPRSSARYHDEHGFEREIEQESMLSGPRHIGMRRHAKIDKNKPLDEQGGDASTG